MKLNVLFWNYNSGKGDATRSSSVPTEQAAVLGRIVQEFEVDILTLAECSLEPTLVLNALRSQDEQFRLPDNPHERFQFYTRFPGERLRAVSNDERISVRQVVIPEFRDFLLAAIHYYDARNNDEGLQQRYWQDHQITLRDAEKEAGHGRMILFGDFNMNPYEETMLDPVLGVGAMISEDLAKLHSKEKGRFCFYNPMWAVMGRNDAPGTYYWSKDQPSNPFWNCIDGVLVRPELIGSLREGDVRIISRLNGPEGDLIRLKTMHWSIAHSDHLPILFSIEVPRA